MKVACMKFPSHLLANLTLKQLFLCSSYIGVGGALSLAVALQHNCTIEDLCIRGNGILDDGTIAIAECLKTNRMLKSLNISKNNFTETGVTEIAEALNHNLVFEMLRIDKEYVGILKQNGNWLTRISIIILEIFLPLYLVLVNTITQNHSQVKLQ